MQSEKLPTNWSTRPATLEDASAANRLFNERSRHFHGSDQATEEEMRAWLSRPDFDLPRDTRVIVDETGSIVGWAHLMNPGEPYVTHSARVAVAIEQMGDGRIWDALLAWCEARAREYISMAPADARVSLECMAGSTDSDRRAAAERLGAEQVRVFNRMRISLATEIPAPAWPRGISVRSYSHDDDLKPLVMAVLEAFADHWGSVQTPLEEELARWQTRIASVGGRFDPSQWHLAVQGETIVGCALCSSDIAGDTSRSELDPLGVRADWRGQGIGLALLHHAFRCARSKGMEAVELAMDSENLTGAARLYERAGMHVIRQMMLFEKELRPGVDLVKRG